jgi:hypothetical protein
MRPLSMASRGAKILRIVLVLAVLCAAGAVIAVIVFAKPLIRKHAISEAKRYGFDLEIGDLDWGIGWVELHRSRFKLFGVNGLVGNAPHVRLELSGFSLKQIRSQKLGIEIEGSVPMVAVELSDWTRAYPDSYKLPAEADDVSVTWRPAGGGEPWMALTAGKIRPAKGGGLFEAPAATLGGFPVGKIGAAWTATESTVALGFGETEVERAPIRVNVNHTHDPPTADVTLQQTDIRRLAQPFGVKIPLENVSASAEARLVFTRGATEGPIDGTLKSRLHGYQPPHPKELDGFVFGDTTTLDTRFQISPDRQRVTLSDTKVAAGAFKLAGAGNVVRHPDHAKIDLDLRGALPCDSLAGAATESELGKLLGKGLGKLAGQAAKNLIGGTVAVRVKIEADSRDLEGAKVTPSIGIGCGLKPFEIDIDLGKLPPLPSGLPPLPSGLPPLPSGFPPPPKLPPFEFPKPEKEIP